MFEEANFIVDKIRNLILNKGELYAKNIAVLYRSSYLSNVLESRLLAHKIKFKKYGGTEYFDKAHIKDLLSFMSAAYREKDYLSWFRIINLVPRIGEKTASEIIKKMNKTNNLYSFAGEYSGKPFFKNLNIIERMVNSLAVDSSNSSLELLVKSYSHFLKIEYKKDSIPKREIDISYFKKMANQFTNLQEFSETLNSPDKDKVKDTEENSITLSTVHSAKGLEWDVVFIISALEGQFPSERADSIPEERRLMYVATTRPKEKLYITFADANYRPYMNISSSGLSSFLKEVNPQLYEIAKLY